MHLSQHTVDFTSEQAPSCSDTVRSVLARKGAEVWSVSPTGTVYEAIALMAEKGVGAVMVVAQGRLAGVVSERDYARKVILMGRSSRETRVHEIMSTPVITVSADATVSDCMRVMTHHRIRHLPVMHGDEILGVVSVGDLVACILAAQAETINQMRNYVAGVYPA